MGWLIYLPLSLCDYPSTSGIFNNTRYRLRTSQSAHFQKNRKLESDRLRFGCYRGTLLFVEPSDKHDTMDDLTQYSQSSDSPASQLHALQQLPGEGEKPSQSLQSAGALCGLVSVNVRGMAVEPNGF